MRKLSTEKRAAVLHALVEGNSINATCRMCGVAKLTVLRLLVDVGQLCQDYHDLRVRDLPCKRLQFDEVWSFVGCKQANPEGGQVSTKKTFIATVQIVLEPGAVEDETAACDWFSGTLGCNVQVFDWQYLQVGGQSLGPSEVWIDADYEKGSVFST